MKSLVVYSSKTGNTEMVAQAVYEALPEPKAIYAVKEAPPPDGYDFIAMGFWVDRGTADARARKYMEKIKGKEKRGGPVRHVGGLSRFGARRSLP